MENTQETSADDDKSTSYIHYLNSLHLEHHFENLDDPLVTAKVLQTAQNPRTHNFVVDFGLTSSCVATNLNAPTVRKLLSVERPPHISTRWINVWSPNDQHALLTVLAEQYDFSPRLLGLILTHHQRALKPVPQSVQEHTQQGYSKLCCPGEAFGSTDDRDNSDDPEAGLPELLPSPSNDSIARADLHRLVQEAWHYVAVDIGRNYLSVGYNTLHTRQDSIQYQTDSRLPQYTRVWTWLIICSDHTVISINEDPFPNRNGNFDVSQLHILTETRRNILTILRALSVLAKSPSVEYNPLMLLPLRKRLGTSPEEAAHYESDAPGLLFYYIFENWHNIATLIARKDGKYATELEDLRKEMLSRPQLSHIERLHTIGSELRVLRRHYESYQHIIDRILEPCEPTQASLENSHVIEDTDNVSIRTMRPADGPIVSEAESRLGVSLSSAARVRFGRLKDMIGLYALSEVDDHLKQRDALVSMNFNLIAIKESQDVEKLTRVALLLTKCTILFLPVSFMSAYFGLDLSSQKYTVVEFWIAFAVILAGSWLLLVLFGLYTESLQTLKFFTVLWRKAGAMWQRQKTSISHLG